MRFAYYLETYHLIIQPNNLLLIICTQTRFWLYNSQLFNIAVCLPMTCMYVYITIKTNKNVDVGNILF